MGGVDDSDGTVGGFIEEGVKLLVEMAKADPKCKKEFEKLRGEETCFGWEDSLFKSVSSDITHDSSSYLKLRKNTRCLVE